MGLLLASQPPSIESILTDLLNEITTIQDPFTLVLDDYHAIDAEPIEPSRIIKASPSVDGVLTFLLEHQPPQMHLVIATREDSHLPLARLRGRGHLTELRARRTCDLRPPKPPIFSTR